MNEIQTFNFNGQSVRVMQTKYGEPWFVGKDVAKVLGYSDPNKAIATHVNSDDKLNDKTSSSLGQRGGWLINESGLYSLILSSKLPSAHAFKRWVTSEVLPSIRKHGAYATPQTIENIINNPDFGIKLLSALKEERAQRVKAEQTIEQNKPKVLFADALTTGKSSVLVGELAKILRQNGVQIGANRLFSWLREHKYLSSRKGEDWNMPTQKSMEAGLFEIKTSSHSAPDGTTFTTRTPKVTGRGQQYFINKFMSDRK